MADRGAYQQRKASMRATLHTTEVILVTSPPNPAAGPQPATDAHRKLAQIADLVDEYAELAQATDNADLMILLFQIRTVLGDGPAEAGQRISGTPTPGQREPY